MDERWRIYVVALMVVVCTTSVRGFKFKIDKTWNGSAIDHKPITVSLSASPAKEYLFFNVSAPFFDDPPSPEGPAGQPFFFLWKYEVVEVYFLNDADQYIQIDVCPWGQYMVLLLSGKYNVVSHSLQMEVTTDRDGAVWRGSAAIPVSYLPEKVTKFNAHAMHGSGDNRVYESLYSAPSTALKPDFHDFQYFKPIDLSSLLPTQPSDPMSQLWSDALQGVLKFKIDKTWNGGALDHWAFKVSLSASPDKEYLFFNVSGPFFDDPPSPEGPAGQPFVGLSEYEVVEVYFLNDADQYLQVDVSPWGQHLVLLFSGQRVYVRHSLHLEVTTDRDGAEWRGSAAIPVSYLPEKVTKFNAFAMHGSGDNRVYESLYPAPSTALKPDFHILQYFKPIDLSSLLPTHASDPMSQLWSDALQGVLKFNIDKTWNGGALDHDPVTVSLSASPDKEYLFFNVSAPFFDDPPNPERPAGQPFYGLWEYEVVEVYFLNDADQYLQVDVGPWGQHIVLLFRGQRVPVRHSLQMEVTTDRDGAVWRGSAAIPVSYLPEKVTKFNAHAMHGSGDNRVYESLYPAPSTALKPDFHALQYFKPIDLSRLLPTQPSDPMSQLWSDALQGLFRYDIATTWDNRPLSSPLVQITLQGFEAGVEMNVTAPFYNDPAPSDTAGEPFYGLWDYEVVEMFFLNKNKEYLEVEFGPWGQHLLMLLQGERNAIKHSLPLDYIVTERIDPVGDTPGQWKASAMIPPDYFPPRVTLVNAYAIHGVDKARQYQALYPAPQDDRDYSQADFHRLDLFRAIDFEFQVKNNTGYSRVWQEAMGSGTSTSSAPMTEAVMPTSLGPLRPAQTVTPEPANTLASESADSPTSEPVDPATEEHTAPDTTEPVDSDATKPTDPDTLESKDNVSEATDTENPEPINTFTPKPTNRVTPEPTETLPVDSTDTVATEVTEAAPQDPTTLPPTTPAPTTLPEPLEVSTPTLSPENARMPVRRRPHPQRVDSSQDPVNFASQNLPVRPRRRPVPNPQQVRPNRRVGNQKPRPQQEFPFHVNLHPEDSFIQHFLSQQQGLGFQAAQGQAPLSQQNQHQQFSPRDQQFRAPVGQQFQSPRDQQFQPGDQQPQPPRDQQFQSPADQQFQPSRDEQSLPPRDQQFQPPRDQQFQPPCDQQSLPPRDQQSLPPRDQQFRIPADQQFQPPRDQQFQPRDQQFQPPVDQQFQPPRDQQFQPPRDQQFQPPADQQFEPFRDQQSLPPHDQQFQPSRDQQSVPPRDEQFRTPAGQQFQPPRDQQTEPRDQQFSAPQEEHPEQPRPSSAGQHEFPPSREGGAPLGVEEKDVGLQEVEEVLVSLTEGSPALPPPHPICFSPGLVPDEHRCWVFHECELKDGQWEVYSWKCMRGHVYDPFNVACVPGRCRRRG